MGLFSRLKEKKLLKEEAQIQRQYSEEHGFLLNINDLREFMRYQARGFEDNFVNRINEKGYLSPEIGEYLESLVNDPNDEVYIKSIHSSHAEPIFEEGIRCFNNLTSGFANVPTSVEKVNLDSTISKGFDLVSVVYSVKRNYGISQGGNPIDGTLILTIPKGTEKEDLLYYNDESNTFNIRPEYIACFIQTNEKRDVRNIYYNEGYNKNIANEKRM